MGMGVVGRGRWEEKTKKVEVKKTDEDGAEKMVLRRRFGKGS